MKIMRAGHFLALTPLLTTLAASAPVPKLAIIVEDQRLSHAADLLTVELSKSHEIQLLEREQINRLLKEQSLTARIGTDFVKIGQILGADGLLMLDVVQRQDRSLISTRLSAVKPGVVLDTAEYPFPQEDAEQWISLLRERCEPLFPKLGVLAKDAVPISMLNIRSAVKTADGEALERQLNLLLFRRLMREPEIFVLERQKLPTLAEEKNFKEVGNEPFWNGSYLLEGTIDRAGYKDGMITLSAHLTAPGKKAPMDFEVQGPRTEAAPLLRKLAVEVITWLKGQSNIRDWDMQDEANEYFDEARWAWRWGMVPEALAASDSAWALGRHDMECATIRVKAAARLATLVQPNYHPTSYPAQTPSPGARDLGFAERALASYEEFGRTLSEEEPKVDSAWYDTGIEALTAASKVLQFFHFYPQAQSIVHDKLAEVRLSARSVAAWISRSPSVRARFWPAVPSRREQEVEAMLLQKPNVLCCMADYGRFWQDRPEDCVRFWREVMSSPLFYYIHHRLCIPQPQSPRFTAWEPGDRSRVEAVWDEFAGELASSTNLELRVEAKLVRLIDSQSEADRAGMTEDLIGTLFASKDATANSIPLLYMGWDASHLGSTPEWHSVPWQQGELLARPWREHERRARVAAQDRSFEEQKQYLHKLAPLVLTNFAGLFQFSYYSKAQAEELQPLLANYKSSLLAQSATNQNLRDQTNWALPAIERVESDVRTAVNHFWTGSIVETGRSALASAPRSAREMDNTARPGPLPGIASRAGRTSGPTPTNHVAQKFRAPMLSSRLFLTPEKELRSAEMSRTVAIGRRVREGRLWLDLRYIGTGADHWEGAVAACDLNTNRWNIIQYPGRGQSWIYQIGADYKQTGSLDFEVFKDALYVSEWHESMKKFPLQSNRWETLPIPVEKPTQLFALGDHLYAANDESIFEILDEGQGTRLLASCRRRPIACALDSLDSFDEPILFSGPQNSVCASVGDKVVSWNGQDWNEILSFRCLPVVCDDGVILRSKSPPVAQFWFLPKNQSKAELYWEEEWVGPTHPYRLGLPNKSKNDAEPAWKSNPALSLGSAGVFAAGSNLYFFAAHVDRTNGNRVWTPTECHAELIVLERGFPTGLLIPIKLPPGLGFVPDPPYVLRFPWMSSLAGFLLIAQPSWRGALAIPWAEIESALAAEKVRQRLITSKNLELQQWRDDELLGCYDTNHNGVLDEQELKRMVRDPAWLDGQLEFQVKKVLNEFDRDGDQKLDREELDLIGRETFVRSLSIRTREYLMRRFPQMPLLLSNRSIDQILETYDGNKDGALDEGELRALARALAR